MLSVNHVLSSRTLPSGIFDDLYRRLVAVAPEDVDLSTTVRPDRAASLRHYHRPHRERRLIGPAVATVHHDPRDAHPWLRLPDFLPRWRECVKVICLNSGQQALLAGHGITTTEIIPHGIDRHVLPLPAAARSLPPERVRLGLVSKRYARGVKGEGRLERLFAALDPARFSFVLAGEGRWRDAASARTRGFAVECFEALPYRLFGDLYGRMDVLLILSDFEGGPACLPEALGAGVPVAARPVGMVPDWITDGANGVLLDDATLEDQVAALAEPATLERLNAGAFAAAASVPAWEEVLGRQIALYRAIVTEAGR